MVTSDFVTLKGGLIVPAQSCLLAFELEDRGFKLSRDGNVLVVQPHDRLTRYDCSRIRRWKWHLLSLLDYKSEVVQ
jgi:RNase P/RNase MRP subunit p29